MNNFTIPTTAAIANNIGSIGSNDAINVEAPADAAEKNPLAPPPAAENASDIAPPTLSLRFLDIISKPNIFPKNPSLPPGTKFNNESPNSTILSRAAPIFEFIFS